MPKSNKVNKNFLNYLAKEAVSGLKCDISGICVLAAEKITPKFLENGYSDFYIVEGYVRVPGWTGRTQHTWLELYDGDIIDSTFNQLPEGTERLKAFQKKYTPKEYMKLVEMHTIPKSDVEKYQVSINKTIKDFFGSISEVDLKADKKMDKPDKGSADKPPSGGADSKPVPGGEPAGDAGSGKDIFGGSDDPSGGGGDDPFGGGGSGGGGSMGGEPGGDSGGPDDGGADEKSKITNYSEKLKSSKVIKFQKMEPEPGYKFELDDKFFSENYIGKDKNGSLMIAIPKMDTNDKEKSLNFIKKLVIPKIDETIKKALSQRKRVVLMSDGGIPYIKGKYSKDEQGIIAKYLNDKYKGGYFIFDTWSPQEYYAFISNDDLWQQVKERTEAENLEIKSSLYLYLLTTLHGRKFADKLKTENVLKMLESWGIDKNDVEKFTSEGLSKIASVVYPELANNPESLTSFIIKTYLQLLRVNMMKKVLKYEKEGKLVVVLTDEHTAWTLKQSFDKSDEMRKEQTPKETPEAPKEEPSPEKSTPETPPAKPQTKETPPAEKEAPPEKK